MFYYIYKLKENGNIGNINTSDVEKDDYKLEFKKFNVPKYRERTYKKFTSPEIDGEVIIKENGYESDIPFKLRSKSGFVFIQTDLQHQKNKVVKILDSILEENKLENFMPSDVNEMKFIYHTGKLNHAKFFLDDDIVTDDEIEEESCIKEDDCELFEASLELDINNHKIPLYYYGDAIQFPENVDDEKVELAIQTFEKAMLEP
jgi:hypothetical protein